MRKLLLLSTIVTFPLAAGTPGLGSASAHAARASPEGAELAACDGQQQFQMPCR
jgi:hypothetical protein